MSLTGEIIIKPLLRHSDYSTRRVQTEYTVEANMILNYIQKHVNKDIPIKQLDQGEFVSFRFKYGEEPYITLEEIRIKKEHSEHIIDHINKIIKRGKQNASKNNQ